MVATGIAEIGDAAREVREMRMRLVSCILDGFLLFKGGSFGPIESEMRSMLRL